MKEKIRIQSKHSIVKLRKTLYLTITLAFFLQQVVPYSSAFAMDPDDFKNDDLDVYPTVSPTSPIEIPKSKSKQSKKSRPKKTPLPTFSLTYFKTLKLEDLEKDLEQRRFKAITETDQRSLFKLIKGHKFRNLVLRETGALQDRFFKKAQLEYLLVLNLERDVSLSDKIVPLIAKKALSLESLTLAHISNIKKIGKQKGIFNDFPLYILFPSLRYLNISYGGINTVLIEAPKLEVFKARSTPLQVLDIKHSNKTLIYTTDTALSVLKKADLRETQSLPLHTFVRFLQIHPELKVQAEALQKLPPIPAQEIKLPLEEENLKRFTEQYYHAMEANDFEAQYQIGEMYVNGQGVKHNTEKAMDWYGRAFEGIKNAAQQGHINTQYQLAEMYAKGQGVKQNFKTALKWYRKAAKKGHEKAQLLLETYARFLNGKLVYKPNKANDKGMVVLPIADLANPLNGEFDLSECGDAEKYLSINTGYRKGTRSENKDKVEIWFIPHFLIENNPQVLSRHFKEVMGHWNPLTAPVGSFFTMGGEDTIFFPALERALEHHLGRASAHEPLFDYATRLTWDDYNNVRNNLYKIHSDSMDVGLSFEREVNHNVRFNDKSYPKDFYIVFD